MFRAYFNFQVWQNCWMVMRNLRKTKLLAVSAFCYLPLCLLRTQLLFPTLPLFHKMKIKPNPFNLLLILGKRNRPASNNDAREEEERIFFTINNQDDVVPK